MDIIIRRAGDTDIPDIYQLVKTLAIYEKAPEAVTATLEDYYNDFRADIFQCHVAETEGQVVGMVLYYTTYSTWKGRMLHLEDFVVYKAYRRLGIGQLLWGALIEEAKQRKARLLKWQVLDWNESAIQFYKKNNAIIEKDWYNGKIFL